MDIHIAAAKQIVEEYAKDRPISVRCITCKQDFMDKREFDVHECDRKHDHFYSYVLVCNICGDSVVDR